MKPIILITAVALGACSQTLPDYQNMTEAQQQAFMENYRKDMMKIYSGANAMGKMRTDIQADAATDTITSLMTMDIDAKGAAGKAMAQQMGDMMLEQNCTTKYMTEFVEAGITYRMMMVDKNNKTMVDIRVSPENCAPFL